MLQSIGAQQSMSRKGNCYDNAVCESFFHSLKVGLDAHRVYEGRTTARSDLFEFIEAFYNRERIHSALGSTGVVGASLSASRYPQYREVERELLHLSAYFPSAVNAENATGCRGPRTITEGEVRGESIRPLPRASACAGLGIDPSNVFDMNPAFVLPREHLAQPPIDGILNHPAISRHELVTMRDAPCGVFIVLERSPGRLHHLGGTSKDGKYVLPYMIDATSVPSLQLGFVRDAEPLYLKFKTTEELVAALQLKEVSGKSSSSPAVYTREGYNTDPYGSGSGSGRYIIQESADGTKSVWYSGGYHQDGTYLPPQTFLNGRWRTDLREQLPWTPPLPEFPVPPPLQPATPPPPSAPEPPPQPPPPAPAAPKPPSYTVPEQPIPKPLIDALTENARRNGRTSITDQDFVSFLADPPVPLAPRVEFLVDPVSMESRTVAALLLKEIRERGFESSPLTVQELSTLLRARKQRLANEMAYLPALPPERRTGFPKQRTGSFGDEFSNDTFRFGGADRARLGLNRSGIKTPPTVPDRSGDEFDFRPASSKDFGRPIALPQKIHDPLFDSLPKGLADYQTLPLGGRSELTKPSLRPRPVDPFTSFPDAGGSLIPKRTRDFTVLDLEITPTTLFYYLDNARSPRSPRDGLVSLPDLEAILVEPKGPPALLTRDPLSARSQEIVRDLITRIRHARLGGEWFTREELQEILAAGAPAVRPGP